jgi:hypothetical protein
MATFTIKTMDIFDWDSFHAVFQQSMKFFKGYGRNMDAWIDCMSDLHGDRALSDHHLPADEQVQLVLHDAESFMQRCPHIALELIISTACVNRRYRESKSGIRVALIPE